MTNRSPQTIFGKEAMHAEMSRRELARLYREETESPDLPDFPDDRRFWALEEAAQHNKEDLQDVKETLHTMNKKLDQLLLPVAGNRPLRPKVLRLGAAMIIQAHWRRFLAKQKVGAELLVHQTSAAIALQAIWRGRSARIECAELWAKAATELLLHQNSAAIALQAIWRGRSARIEFLKVRAAVVTTPCMCTTKVPPFERE